MIVALPYEGRAGVGYAIVSTALTVSSEEYHEIRALNGALETPIFDTGTSVGLFYSVHETHVGVSLDDLAEESEQRIRLAGLSNGGAPATRPWAKLARRIGSFGLVRVDLDPVPTLYGIEATPEAQRVTFFSPNQGGVFVDELDVLGRPWNSQIHDTHTTLHASIDDDGLQHLIDDPDSFVRLASTRGPTMIVYTTDAGVLRSNAHPSPHSQAS